MPRSNSALRFMSSKLVRHASSAKHPKPMLSSPTHLSTTSSQLDSISLSAISLNSSLRTKNFISPITAHQKRESAKHIRHVRVKVGLSIQSSTVATIWNRKRSVFWQVVVFDRCSWWKTSVRLQFFCLLVTHSAVGSALADRVNRDGSENYDSKNPLRSTLVDTNPQENARGGGAVLPTKILL